MSARTGPSELEEMEVGGVGWEKGVWEGPRPPLSWRPGWMLWRQTWLQSPRAGASPAAGRRPGWGVARRPGPREGGGRRESGSSADPPWGFQVDALGSSFPFWGHRLWHQDPVW